MYGTPKQRTYAEALKHRVIEASVLPETKAIFDKIQDAAWWIDNWKNYRYDGIGLTPDVLLCEEMLAKVKPEVKFWSFDIEPYDEAISFLHQYYVRSENSLQRILDGDKKCWFVVHVHKYTGNWNYPFISTNEDKVNIKLAKIHYKVIAIYDPSKDIELEKEELEDGSYRTLSKAETFLQKLEYSLRDCWLNAPVTIMQHGDHDMVDAVNERLTEEEREEIVRYL